MDRGASIAGSLALLEAFDEASGSSVWVTEARRTNHQPTQPTPHPVRISLPAPGPGAPPLFQLIRPACLYRSSSEAPSKLPPFLTTRFYSSTRVLLSRSAVSCSFFPTLSSLQPPNTSISTRAAGAHLQHRARVASKLSLRLNCARFDSHHPPSHLRNSTLPTASYRRPPSAGRSSASQSSDPT